MAGTDCLGRSVQAHYVKLNWAQRLVHRSLSSLVEELTPASFKSRISVRGCPFLEFLLIILQRLLSRKCRNLRDVLVSIIEPQACASNPGLRINLAAASILM